MEHLQVSTRNDTGLTQATLPLGLYVHLPWCVKKCPYCDFNSVALKGNLPESRYLQALLTDLDEEAARCAGRSISSIFIGGGTPSLFSPDSIAALLDGICARVALEPDIEITLEANPGTVDSGHFSGFKAAGVNRLSIGVQSFDDGMLEQLGRIHDGDAARKAAERAAAVFENFNLDLMHALPGQTEAQAQKDVLSAVALSPSHLSYYQLTLEPNTPFYHRPPVLPDDDNADLIETAGKAVIAEHGYAQYEVSAYARAGRQCRHNLNYWRFGDYLGIGAGAHGKLTDPATGAVSRRAKERHSEKYMAKALSHDSLFDSRELKPGDLILEFMLNALRLNEGFRKHDFEASTGLSFTLVEPVLATAVQDGLVDMTEKKVQPTALGNRYLNELTERFLPQDVRADR